MNTLILTIILIPLIEIYLFIEIGGQIGAGYTILFILLTAVIGLYFAKLEGINTIRSGMNQLTNNQMPIYEMISGAALAFNNSRFCNRYNRFFVNYSFYTKFTF